MPSTVLCLLLSCSRGYPPPLLCYDKMHIFFVSLSLCPRYNSANPPEQVTCAVCVCCFPVQGGSLLPCNVMIIYIYFLFLSQCVFPRYNSASPQEQSTCAERGCVRIHVYFEHARTRATETVLDVDEDKDYDVSISASCQHVHANAPLPVPVSNKQVNKQ